MTAKNVSPTAPLYTELPYPADGVVRTITGRILRLGLRQHAPELLGKDRIRICDVGCGTGEICTGLAKSFPNAEVIGIDINPASLEMARDLADRHNLKVRFLLGDIMRNLPETTHLLYPNDPSPFDLIVSTGVLHHIDNPARGFAEVRKLIKPDGLFLCYMYSSYGRRDDILIKAILNDGLPGKANFQDRAKALRWLKLSRKHSLADAIGKLRYLLKFGSLTVAPFEWLQVLIKRNPLTHLSDTFSNPCEHYYKFEELQDMFAKTGWQFVALAEKGGLPTSPRAHTQDPKTLAILKEMPKSVVIDYFSFYYRATGFTFFLRPA